MRIRLWRSPRQHVGYRLALIPWSELVREAMYLARRVKLIAGKPAPTGGVCLAD